MRGAAHHRRAARPDPRDDRMNDASGPIAEAARRFPSLAAMRSAHRDLLARHRRSGNRPELLNAMKVFLRRGGATGALLEIDSERHAGQSVLDYWATILYRAGV